MDLYHLLYRTVDFLFPQKETVKELESLSPEEFIKKVPRAEISSTRVLAFFSYRHPLMRQAVWEIKYAYNTRVFLLLGKTLGILLEKYKGAILIPLPLSSKRFRERGYNQTEELAKRIVDEENIKLFEIRTDILKKKYYTSPQTKALSRKNRLKNVADSFEARNIECLKNRIVIILDDVTTTGATFLAAAGALKASGARRIICIALAH